MATEKQSTEKEYTVEEKLYSLYQLQKIMSDIDKIRTLRGELPLEVQDLEDEIAGLETRMRNYQADIKQFEVSVNDQKHKISESTGLIEKYKAQLDNVRNNREYDNLSKEIEFQGLEMEFSEKRIREFNESIAQKKDDIAQLKEILEGRKVAKGLRVIVIPATQKIYMQAIEEGLVQTFIRAGAVVSTPTCGPCLGGYMGILAEGERCVSTTNRNFVGRMGHVESEIYLASPAVAAASAITGMISDPRKM